MDQQTKELYQEIINLKLELQITQDCLDIEREKYNELRQSFDAVCNSFDIANAIAQDALRKNDSLKEQLETERKNWYKSIDALYASRRF